MSKFAFILQPDSGVSSARQSVHSVDTPRGSWASFDLRNSVSDPLIPSLLERVPPETIDQLNEVRRQEERQVCLVLSSVDYVTNVNMELPSSSRCHCSVSSHSVIFTEACVIQFKINKCHIFKYGTHFFKHFNIYKYYILVCFQFLFTFYACCVDCVRSPFQHSTQDYVVEQKQKRKGTY